jgi:DNA-binding transcriptional LysR family regulator
MAWLAERLGDRRPRVRASRFSLQLEAIRAGAGLGILPCFIGDADPGLVRLTAPVPDLTADFWLLVHRDMKDVPRVRRVIDGVREAFRRDAPMLQGRRGK